MKTKLLLLFMALSMGAYAQGNLQFNQVLTFTLTEDDSNVYTVPAGKVAKITAATLYLSGSLSSFVMINGIKPAGFSGDKDQLNGAWLKAGDVISFDIYYADRPVFLSLIEYNIISP